VTIRRVLELVLYARDEPIRDDYAYTAADAAERPVSYAPRSTWLPWRRPFTVVRH